MAWLLTFLLSHSAPTALNRWACDTVNAQYKPGEVGGCYDWCWERSVDHVELERDPNGHDYSHELQNACAVVMHGGEY